MKRSTILTAAFSLLLVAGCVPYYVERPGVYEPTPTVVEVPVLPPQVILEERPYYVYRNYYYYWDYDRNFWLYSKSRRGPWYQLPRSHYPGRFQYRGRWYERDRESDWDRYRGRERGRER